nr:hypothetical protein BCCFPMHH_00010 [uncultured bacterium]
MMIAITVKLSMETPNIKRTNAEINNEKSSNIYSPK